MVLNRVSHFVCCYRNGGEGVAGELIRRQSNGLVMRVIVIAFLGFLDFHGLHAVLVE